MLRACALQNSKSWDKHLPYVEFSYNNSYQASLKMAPFEALYGKKCRTPLFWNQVGERKVFGLDVIKEAEEQVKEIQNNLKIAQSKPYMGKSAELLCFGTKLGKERYLVQML